MDPETFHSPQEAGFAHETCGVRGMARQSVGLLGTRTPGHAQVVAMGGISEPTIGTAEEKKGATSAGVFGDVYPK